MTDKLGYSVPMVSVGPYVYIVLFIDYRNIVVFIALISSTPPDLLISLYVYLGIIIIITIMNTWSILHARPEYSSTSPQGIARIGCIWSGDMPTIPDSRRLHCTGGLNICYTRHPRPHGVGLISVSAYTSFFGSVRLTSNVIVISSLSSIPPIDLAFNPRTVSPIRPARDHQ